MFENSDPESVARLSFSYMAPGELRLRCIVGGRRYSLFHFEEFVCGSVASSTIGAG